jgi:hypothetical protein
MRLTRFLRKARRQMMRFTQTNRIVSFGGVGSTSLVAHLEDGNADRNWYHQQGKHCFRPDLLPEVQRGLEVKACFIFGDPYHSVISVFRRGLQRRHERSMSRATPGYTPVLRRNTTLQEYLEGGVDRFFLEDHLDNWIGYRGNQVRILAVKYEALGDHIEEVLSFLDCLRPFVVRSRTSSIEDQPEAIRRGLEAIYGPLKVRIDSLPSMTRINAG